MKKILKIYSIILLLLWPMFQSCDKEVIQGYPNTYSSQLQNYLSGISALKESVKYGNTPGTYPEDSKQILEDLVLKITTVLEEATAKNTDVNEDTWRAMVTYADQQIDAFKLTIQINYSAEVAERLTALRAKSISMKDLRDNSTYGIRTGEYPVTSKSILTDAAVQVDAIISGIESTTVVATTTLIQQTIDAANQAIESFHNSVRTVDDVTYELEVNGKNGGYIDFGYSPDYAIFGTTGSQQFTVEFWINIKEYGNEDNSIMLSTFVDNSSVSPNYRSGWMMYSRNRNIFRWTTGVIDVNNNNNYMLWEPNFDYTGSNEWVHYAVVFNDAGLDGNWKVRGKLYKNGVSMGNLDIGEEERKYNSNYQDLLKIPMTAFGRFTANGSFIEGFKGRMKFLRIWKTSKSATEIRSSYLAGNDNAVSTDADNLVAAWDFRSKLKPTGATFTDITGKHVATIKGSYTWEEALE